ncbi:hypothetical protein SAMN05660464_1518 [Geodermatophilus dictyosporus]|uniref:Uncharacterized protein n=1 Tax=Geodermatophilus dictyosporus TaxID=1523247 RepID=A0A1I5L3U4_9ACTN|nr:hypothetical protein [Geodermatophilus dictyosporus]SFO91431.1 hypothetical protein SAMN05660464_1518 [Geodermatophilus dictyosporus]
MPSADAFRALARSSPERWSTLRFTERRRRDGAWSAPVRAWLRRPDLLRVEDAGGRLLGVVRETGADHDPMWQDYRWVAELRPEELADGLDPDARAPAAGAALELDGLREVEHAGRPAWEALAVPTDRYEPRCGCCPLLRSRRVDELEWGSVPEGVEYPTAHLVRLDVRTGVCVWAEALDGTYAGETHDLRIEAVDEPVPDDLFRRARRRGAV